MPSIHLHLNLKWCSGRCPNNCPSYDQCRVLAASVLVILPWSEWLHLRQCKGEDCRDSQYLDRRMVRFQEHQSLALGKWVSGTLACNPLRGRKTALLIYSQAIRSLARFGRLFDPPSWWPIDEHSWWASTGYPWWISLLGLVSQGLFCKCRREASGWQCSSSDQVMGCWILQIERWCRPFLKWDAVGQFRYCV